MYANIIYCRRCELFNSVTNNPLPKHRSFFHENLSHGIYWFPIILYSLYKFFINNQLFDNNAELRFHNTNMVPLMLIHSNDVHVNPGPNNFNKVFSFCNWNFNSIVKNNFYRIDLLKVQASIYNYDVISLCETSLNDDVEIPETLIDGYISYP